LAITKVKTGVIADGTITNADLSSTVAVTGGQIADDAITTAKILDNNITIAKISGSAAAGANTFLKKDGTWAAVGGAATEMYSAASAPGSPTVGYLWYDTTTSKGKVYSGTSWLIFAEDFSATGGTITTYTGYKVHTFTVGGSLTVTGAEKAMDFIIVAGGGGGGGGQGGGGGGGGMRVFTGVTIPVGTHTVTVGNGGAHGTNVSPMSNGLDSVFTVDGGSTYTATGGGAGGSYNTHAGPNAGAAGGSGGGGGSGHVSPGAGGAGNTPSTSPSQGASGAGVTYSEMGGGGGGGGASGVAGATNPAIGGDGTANDFQTGVSAYYAGGGAGRGASSRAGGSGGGGATATSGTVNTGGGGGGGSNDTNSGAGGSGIVIIRYAV